MLAQATEPERPEAEPVNNIYHVPIEKLSALECSDGGQLIGAQETTILVEADNEVDAVMKVTEDPQYISNYAQLTLEQKKVLAPIRLNRKRGEITEVLHCERRFKNRRGDYTCGRPIHDIPEHSDKDDDMFNINGEFGMCCIEGYDVPEGFDCPYEKKD